MEDKNNKTFLVASDLHDSMLGLERVLELATEHRANKIILLGDIFGAHAYEMVERLNTVAYKLTIVKGNNDGFADDLPNKDFKVFDTTYENINGKIAYLCHGHKINWFTTNELGAKLILFGHFHRPMLEKENGVTLLCPGSMSQPRSSVGKTYAIINSEKIQILTDDGYVVNEMNFSDV